MKYSEEQFEQWVQQVFDEKVDSCRLESCSVRGYTADFHIYTSNKKDTWTASLSFNGENADCEVCGGTVTAQSSIPSILVRRIQELINESL